MDYKEALKKVQTKKAKEHYMVITLGYDFKLVLPHKDGLVFMESLNAAEQLNDPYQGEHRITELERGKLSVNQMSQEEYERYKIAALLNLSITEVKELGLQAN